MPTAKFVGSKKVSFAKRMLARSFFATILGCLLFVFQLPEAVAAELSNGTYVVEYEMLQADSDSVSIANDYFEKPATLTVDNGIQYIQFTVNRSEWVKVLTATNGESFVDVDVVSEDTENDQRVIAFQVDGDISQPVLMQMHVKIEDMVPVYDHKYTVRLNFDLETMQVTDAPAVVVGSSDSGSTTDEGIGNNVILYILIAVLAAAIVIIARKFSSSKK
ncbi:NEAT domain-containing protein [Sporosarcina sp. FSL K6-3457]|uniref:NEAT domain-containing protein n=1 Tax=Sporosarcina sp. FSL K6-3457 TaxID=2978204 RepID=UPI0030F6A374